jgi:hypothetical protein
LGTSISSLKLFVRSFQESEHRRVITAGNALIAERRAGTLPNVIDPLDEEEVVIIDQKQSDAKKDQDKEKNKAKNQKGKNDQDRSEREGDPKAAEKVQDEKKDKPDQQKKSKKRRGKKSSRKDGWKEKNGDDSQDRKDQQPVSEKSVFLIKSDGKTPADASRCIVYAVGSSATGSSKQWLPAKHFRS